MEALGLTAKKQWSLLKTERETLVKFLSRYEKMLSSGEAKDLVSARPYFDRLKQLEAKFDRVQEETKRFNATVEEQGLMLETSDFEIEFLNRVDAARGAYLSRVEESTVSESTRTSTSSRSHSHLPRITLPTFSGNIEEWEEFFSLFVSLVDSDPTLADIEKFQYLRTSLRGDAVAVISSLSLTPNNYALALTALRSRYENKRRLAALHLNRITGFSKSTKYSHHNLQAFLTTHENNFNALEKLGLPDMCDFIKLHLALDNLDPGTRRAFEDKVASKSTPSYRDLIEFVSERSRVAELMGESRASKPAPHQESPCGTVGPVRVREVDPEERKSSRKSVAWHPEVGDGAPPLQHRQPPSPRLTRKSPATESACWNCGGPHFYSRCPKPRGRFCYRCGTQGVTTNSCPKCRPGNYAGSPRRGSF